MSITLSLQAGTRAKEETELLILEETTEEDEEERDDRTEVYAVH